MEILEVVSPGLSEYMQRVRLLASQYVGNADKWYDLRANQISVEEDREEFIFIRMALWDRLMEEEFFASASPPLQINLFGQCDTEEPGIPRVLLFRMVRNWEPTPTQNSLTSCLILASF